MTPYYLIHERKLLKNLKKIQYVRDMAKVKVLLTLKCFSTWPIFPIMKKYLDGVACSSINEVFLGHEKFGKEIQVYSPGFSNFDIINMKTLVTKFIFNSVSQLKRYDKMIGQTPRGLRINPGFGHSDFDLADPSRRYSRLGESDMKQIEKALPHISGVLFHFNCENTDFGCFKENLDSIRNKYQKVLKGITWISLGGGIAFTDEGYPLDKFCMTLQKFKQQMDLTNLYLEPGEAVVHNTTELVTSVVDIVHNEYDIAIVDASAAVHMPDLLLYGTPAQLPDKGPYTYMVAGRSCLAGDIFGTFRFTKKLRVGSEISIQNAGAYTMVQRSWFNGLLIPSVIFKRLNGKLETIQTSVPLDFLAFHGNIDRRHTILQGNLAIS